MSGSTLAGVRAHNRRRLIVIVLGTGVLGCFGALALQRPAHDLEPAWQESQVGKRIDRDCEYLGRNPEGYFEFRHRKTGIVFVWIPGVADRNAPRFGSRGSAATGDLLIAKHEVSQRQWEDVMGPLADAAVDDRFPVGDVTWDECREFCRQSGLDLPYESEWERCCSDAATDEGHLPLHRVDVGPRNGFGLLNMAGNASEWCEFAARQGVPSNGGFASRQPRLDPLCKPYRGGSLNGPWPCGLRMCGERTGRTTKLGFRPVLRLSEGVANE